MADETDPAVYLEYSTFWCAGLAVVCMGSLSLFCYDPRGGGGGEDYLPKDLNPQIYQTQVPWGYFLPVPAEPNKIS